MEQTEIMKRYRHPAYRREIGQFSEEYARRTDGVFQWAAAENPFCGDSLRVGVWLTGENQDTIADVCYDGYGCSLCVASAEVLLENVKGKTIARADGTDAAEIMEKLGGISVGRTRKACVQLPVKALRRALHQDSDSSVTFKEYGRESGQNPFHM